MLPFGELKIFDSSGKNPRAFKITQQFTYVGKDKDCDIRFENSVCGRKQFLLTANGNGTVKIQNLSKKYATQVNHKPIGFQVDHDLKENDIITAAGRTLNWSYQASNAEELPQIRAWKRTRNSEPVRQVAVVTPHRQEMVVNDEESLPPKKRRKTLYDSSVHSTSHRCSNIRILPEQSSFARKVSYDRMLKGKATPNRGRLTSVSPGRLSSSLQTPRGSAKNNTKLSFAHPLESQNLVYYHDAAFNNSITPRTFYSGQTSSAPFTFRGFNPVAEESSSSILGEDHSYSSIDERNTLGRRSGRVSTPLHKKRSTSSFQSSRTLRNRSILTGTPSVYFPTIQEGIYSESDNRHNAQLSDSYFCTNSETLASSLNDPDGRDSTPASYFSPTSSGSPRMMRAESPNIQDVNGVPRSPYRGRQTGRGDLVSSGCSTSFGTPQEVFHQSQHHDSLFGDTSRRSQLRQRRSQGSFPANQSHYGSHDSILQSPQSRTINTSAYLNTPRSRSVIDSPRNSTFSPMSYNNTDYVLLSPTVRNLVSRRYNANDQSLFSQSPYSPSQNTLDFTASPLQHPTPHFAKTPKRSLSIHVLTKSLQKKTNHEFNKSNMSSPKRRKSQRHFQFDASISRSASIPLLTTPTQGYSTHSLTNKTSVDIADLKPSIVGDSDPSMLNFDINQASSSNKTPRSSTGGENAFSRVSRRSQSAPSPTHLNSSPKTRKSVNKVSTELSSLGSPVLVNSSCQSRKSGNAVPDVPMPQFSKEAGSPILMKSSRKSRKSLGQEELSTSVHQTLERSNTFVLADYESVPARATRRSRSVQSPKPIQSSSVCKSRKSSIASVNNNLEPISPSTPKLSGSLKPTPDSKLSGLSLGQNASLGRFAKQSPGIPYGTPTQSCSARRSRKIVTGSAEDNVEPLVASSNEFSQEEQILPCWASLRSRSVPSGTPTQSSYARKSKKCVTGNAEASSEPSVASVSIKLSQKEKNLSSRVIRQSTGVMSDTPTQSSSARMSRKSGMGSAEDISEPNVPSTSYTLSQEEQHPLSQVTRLSTGVPSGMPARLCPANKSKKSYSVSTKDISELSLGSMANKINQEEFQLSKRSQNNLSGTPIQSSSARKSKLCDGSSEGEDKLSHRVTRRSLVLSSLLPQSDKGSPRENVNLTPEINVVLPSPLSRSVAQQAADGLSRKNLREESSSRRVSELQHCSPPSSTQKRGLNTSKNHTTPKRTATSTLALTSSASLELDQSTSPSGKKRSLRNQTEVGNVNDIKPSVTENGSLEWPVSVPTNSSAAMQIFEDVKPSTSSALRINESIDSPKANSPHKLYGSAILGESAGDLTTRSTYISTSISPLQTTIAFSTPALSHNKKLAKVTSTPFPKGLVSGRNGSPISLQSTLSIEVDTAATTSHLSSYTLSDSPHYDTISDEGLFDVTDAPGTSARTSMITKPLRRNSKRSVSFVAIKTGVKNRKSKTPPTKNVTVKEKFIALEGEVTPPNSSLEVNLRSSRNTSTAKKQSPSTPLTAGRAARLDNRLAKSFSEVSVVNVVKTVSPEKDLASSSRLATSPKTLTSPTARRSLDMASESSMSNRLKSLADVTTRNQSPKTPNSAVSPDQVTPPRSRSPEVTLRSSRKSTIRSMQLAVLETPKSALRRNPRQSVKKASPSATLTKKLDSVRLPGESAIKKLKLDPDKPDKKKMAALWVCHKKKSGKSIMPKQKEARRSFERLLRSPTKLNMTVPRDFKFQTSDNFSTSSLLEANCADMSRTSLTPLKDLDVQPQQLSPEDDLLNALDLSRKISLVSEPQKPSRRLRSSTRRLTPTVSLAPVSPSPGTLSPPKSAKKLLFRSPLVDYEGSQPRGELQVTSSSVKSILIPSPTRSSDEPMSRVFTTSPVVDYTDSTGKKKLFRASPTSKSGGIRELLPSEEVDLTGVRDLFEHPSSPSVVPSAGSRKRQAQKGVVTVQGVSPPKVAKLSAVASSSSSRSTAARSPKPQQKPAQGRPKKVKGNKAEENKKVAPPKKAFRVSVATAKAAVRTRAVGSKKSRSSQGSTAPKKLHSKKVETPEVQASTSKMSTEKTRAPKIVPEKASNPKLSVKMSPKKLRSKNVETSKQVKHLKESFKQQGSASKDSPKKRTASKDPPKKKTSSKDSPKKRTASKDPPKKKTSSKDSSKKNTASKNSPMKRTASPKKKTSSKDSPKKKTASKDSPKKKTARKDSPKKKPAVKDSPKKASTSKGYPKNASVSQNFPKKMPTENEKSAAKTSSAKKKLAPSDSPKKAFPPKGSPRKLRNRNVPASNEAVVKPSTSKEANPEKSVKLGFKSKSDSGKKTRKAAQPHTQKVSPRKTRSAAKPKKGSPKKASLSGRKR